MAAPGGADALDAAVREMFAERWAATGVLDEVVVVAVVGATDEDAARLAAVVPGAGVVDVAVGRDQLEAWMDEVERQLASSGELAGFLQMAPDGFTGTVRLVVDAPVPQLRAWADGALPPGALVVEEREPEPLDLASLVGLDVDDAARRGEERGLSVRRLAPGTMHTADFRPDRLDLEHDAAGTVTRAWLG